jgi:hypothetical protein
VNLNGNEHVGGKLEAPRRASRLHTMASSIWRAGNTIGAVVAKGWNIKIDLISRWGLPPLLD